MAKSKKEMYLDWVNNFITVDKFAEYYNLSKEQAIKVIEEGKKEHHDYVNSKVDFTRVNNDIYGNPRYVFHFLDLSNDYEEAHKLAKSIGASKYRGREYGGGFVIQSYNIQETEQRIKEISKTK